MSTCALTRVFVVPTDLVGPSNVTNICLTNSNYATRYPDAIRLKDTTVQESVTIGRDDFYVRCTSGLVNLSGLGSNLKQKLILDAGPRSPVESTTYPCEDRLNADQQGRIQCTGRYMF